MAGICAVSGVNAENIARKMCQCLKHRGPDYEGVHALGEKFAIGHSGSFKEDYERVYQPLFSEDKTVWITFDGIIYNFEQMKQKLEANHAFRSKSSAELVIHAYEEEGPECVRALNGDFAFCLWDSGKELLFSARDKIGIKPLYHCNRGNSGGFLFSSEMKAFFVDSSVPKKPNKRILSEYLLHGPRVHSGESFFEGINELLPAHYVLVDQNGFRVKKYWSPLQSSRTYDVAYAERADFSCRFLELFQDSVRMRLPQSSRFGTFLSGGLDSASVACIVNHVLRSGSSGDSQLSQELFSAVYPNTEADEKAYALEVANALGSEIDYLYPHVAENLGDLQKFVYSMDEPVPVLSYYAYWCLSKTAAGRGVPVTFSGQGPDETLGGHVEERIAYFRELWSRKKIGQLFLEIIGSLVQYRLGKVLKSDVMGLFGKSRTGKSTIAACFGPDIEETFGSTERPPQSESLNDFLLREVTQTLMLDHLQFGDRSASAFSITTRYPLLDHRLVEFVFALPSNQKFRNGWTKIILRNAMKGIIPEAIRWRRLKLGTPVPLEKWLIELNQEIRAVFTSKKFGERGYFNQSVILALYDRFLKGKMNRVDKAFYAEVFWRVLNLELWFEAYFD